MRFGRWVAQKHCSQAAARMVASRGFASRASPHATARRREALQNLGNFLGILIELLRAPLHQRRENDDRTSSPDGADGWCALVCRAMVILVQSGFSRTFDENLHPVGVTRASPV